jgi:glutathione S-transferase/alpha,alpha-trehalase
MEVQSIPLPPHAQYTKWVVWANSELDPLCFGKGMSGTKLDKEGVKPLQVLENLLEKRLNHSYRFLSLTFPCSDYIVDNEFSVADVAVASYLNYVPIFFRNANLSIRPNIVKYMRR